MRLFNLIALSSLFTLLTDLSAQNGITSVRVHAPQFCNETIEFYIYFEKQFETRKNIATIIVNNETHSGFSFKCPKTNVIYCETKSYTGYFYVEKGENYTVCLPDPDSADGPGPGHPSVYTRLKHLIPSESSADNRMELNRAIMHFDTAYESFLYIQNPGFFSLEQNEARLDSFKIIIKDSFKVTDQDFFSDYLEYRIAHSELLFRHHDILSFYNRYLKNRPLAMNNPAFWDFYKPLFDNYISSLSERSNYSKIKYFMGNDLYDSLTILLKTDPVLQNDTIREFALVDEIFKGFYQNTCSLEFSLHFLDMVHNNSSSLLVKNVAENVKASLTKLQPGYHPPAFTFMNNDGNEFRIEDFKGKYIYLGFCSLNQLGSLKEIEYLKYLQSKHNSYLQILVIVPFSEKDLIKSFSDYHSLGWPLVYSHDETVPFREYKIKSFPQFYLFDREGRFAASPAPLPSENFEQTLFRIMRSMGDI